jgi:hypothetical protein
MTREQPHLSWWARLDDASLYWARGRRGLYVVALRADYWSVDHLPGASYGRPIRQLGMAPTATEAKALAQADYDLARGVEARR